MKKRLLILVLVVIIIASVPIIRYLSWIYRPNFRTSVPDSFLFIRTGADFKDVRDSLEKKGWIRNTQSFMWVAGKKKLHPPY